jgi:DNA-binding response OmpR family regulator
VGNDQSGAPTGVALESDCLSLIEESDVNPTVILLAEDDVQVQYFVWKVLSAEGHTVLTSGNGEVALEASRSYPGHIDLLLTDIEMPRMSGPQLYRNIRAERPGIKVLVMSSDLQWRDQDALNGLPFLQKPFTPTVLRHSIEALLCPVPREWTCGATDQASEATRSSHVVGNVD